MIIYLPQNVSATYTQSITVSNDTKADNFIIQKNKDQIVDWYAKMDIRHDWHKEKTKDTGIFYIKDLSTGTNLVYVEKNHHHSGDWEGRGSVFLKKGVRYEVFVQRHKLRYYTSLGGTGTEKGSTTTTITFYYEPKLTPTLPKLLDQNDNTIFYTAINNLKWNYSDVQGFPQKQVNIVIQKKGAGGVWQDIVQTNNISHSSQTYNANNSLFPTGAYRWQIKGYNSKIWSDYSFQQDFYVDKLVPWPDNGFSFDASLNLTKTTKEETIKDAYSQDRALEYTLEWNKFVDTDENHPVGSGLKEQFLQYNKDGQGWQDLPRSGPDQSSYNFIVNWNSSYKFRMKAKDKVDNTSEWYPLNNNYPQFSTPSKPTRFKDIQFVNGNVNLQFYVHDLANAYNIKWKNTANDSINGETAWITIPADHTGETYTYILSTEDFDFRYNEDYEFAIATRNTENDEVIIYNDRTDFMVANQPPVKPELQSPADNSYFTNAGLTFIGNKTTDPDGHQLEYTFVVEKLIKNQANQLEWIDYEQYNGLEVNNNIEAEVTLEDGHYRWRLKASDGIADSISTYRELYIDITSPKKPVFQLQSTSGDEISSTNQNQISIYMEDYSREYDQYPYPKDVNMVNDIDKFVIKSNFDETVTVNKSELINDKLVYNIKPVNGQHQITVTSYDRAGNSVSNTKTLIFDNQQPNTITFSEPVNTYFINSVTENGQAKVEFNWPDSSDKPTNVSNSGIKKYILQLERVKAGIVDTYKTTASSIIQNNLNYNEQIKLKVKAVDGAGNEGSWSEELSWFTAAEPTGLTVESIDINYQGQGLYQKSINLAINQAEYNYYKIHRLNLSNSAEEELITAAIYDSLQYSQDVDPHQNYQYFIKTYNNYQPGQSTDGRTYGMATEIYIANSLPTIPEVIISGVNEKGYLNTDSTTINVSSKDMFGNAFQRCVDYDNDNLTYHYLVKEDGKILIEKDNQNTSLALADLKEGSEYDLQVKVTDNIKDENGEIEYVSSASYSFTVDTASPVITMTEPDIDYVAEKTITINAVDQISKIKSIEYKWGENGQLQTIPGTGQIQAPHGENKLIVIARDNAGNQVSKSKLYRVDTTAPEITAVQLQDTQMYNGSYYIANNHQIYLDLNFNEDLTNISSYHYGLLAENEPITNLSESDLVKVEVNGINGYNGEQLIQAELAAGQKYYPVIMATNSVGRSTAIQKIEPGFYVDGSGPEISINIKGLVSNQYGTFLTDIEAVSITHDINDQETGIRGIYYGISNDLHGDINWYENMPDLKAAADLTEGETYYLAVKAVNNLGLVSIHYTDGFIVDTNKPEFTKLIGGEELPEGIDRYVQRSNDYLKVSWLVSDISRIAKYYYKIGTSSGSGNISMEFPEADPEGWIEYNSSAYQDSITINKSDFTFADGIYHITVKAIDEAGNENIDTTNEIEINTQLAPVPVLKTDSPYLDRKDSIYFTIEMFEPEQEIAAYRYWIEDITGNIVLNNKEVSTNEKIIDIEENQVSFQDGQDYYIYAQAKYIDGSYSDSGFTKVTIDSTPPAILSISTPEYASNQEISISWLAEEDYSLISYQARIGTEINTGDITDWVDTGRRPQITFNDLEIADGQVIYVTIRAINSSGLTCIKTSKPILIDNTPPPVPVIIDEGLYTNDDTKLSIDWRWTLPDEESGIKNYQVALLTSRNINEDTNWVDVEATKTNYTINQQLTNGQKYYIAVKSINGAGLSSEAISDGIVIDVTKPDPPVIDDHGDYTDSLTTLQGTFNGALDPESGIASFYYSLGTYIQPTLLVNDQAVESNVVGGNNYNLQIGEVYFFEARAKNNANLLSAQTNSNGIMVVEPDKPKVINIEDGGEFSINNKALSFVWRLDDETVPFNYYEYALINSKDASISVWSKVDENYITINAEDIYGEDGSYEDGKTYYLAVRAVNMLGNPTTVKISDGITVDSTPPTTAVIGVEPYTNNHFNLKWNCTDPDTKIIGYQYTIGTTRGGSEVTNGWQYIDTSQLNEEESSERINRVITMDLQHQSRYYLTIKAVNEAGLWSIPAKSSVIIADLESPVTPLVSTEMASTPSYVNKKNLIENISFSTEDLLSGIAGYRYQVVDNNNLTGDLTGSIEYTDDFLKTFSKEDLDIENLSLIENGEYYVVIQSVDRTGNWSSIGYSQKIIVDTIIPLLEFETELDELVTNDGTKEINWSTNEGGVIYYRTVPLDENGLPLNEPEFAKKVIENYTGSFNFSVTDYGTYDFQMYQVDLASNSTDIIKQKVRYNQPPVVNIAGDSSAYKGHSITFMGQVTDDTELARYIWRIGDYQEEKLVGSAENPAEFTYEFLETGSYQLELEVYDVDGASTTETKLITITNTLEGQLILDETWSGNMQMRGTVEVPEGITLTIEPGTVASFPESASLLVKGNLIINGITNSPVTLTGTYWSGLFIRKTALVDEIDYLVVSNAERGLILENQDTIINNSSFIDNGIGIHLADSSPKINKCTVNKNKFYGIKEESGSRPVVLDSLFSSNGNDYYHHLFTNISIDRLNSLDGNSGNIKQ